MFDAENLDRMRYYPVFLLVALSLGIGLSALAEVTITQYFVNQVLVPRFHPVNLGPGDWIERGAHGADRPILVRHPDDTVTDAGQLQGFFQHFYQTPSFLAAALAWFASLFFLVRFWPRTGQASA